MEIAYISCHIRRMIGLQVQGMADHGESKATYICISCQPFLMRSVKIQNEYEKAQAMFEETQKCSNTSSWSDPTNRELRFHSNAWWTWQKIWVALNFKFKSRDFYKRITTTVGRPNTHKKRLNLTPVKHGYTLERHTTKKKQKRSNQTKDPPRELKISVRDEATEDLSFEQSPEIK